MVTDDVCHILCTYLFCKFNTNGRGIAKSKAASDDYD